jgi:glycosyltransferase involved in cell wall biosynthesis
MFSVVVPTFNRAHLLRRCIHSIRQQSETRVEIIVVDDGSTDDTQATVDELNRFEQSVRYVYQHNQGAGDARNLGATMATGDYVVFLDSDDEFVPEWGQAFQQAARQAKPEVICCGIRWQREDGSISRISRPGAVERSNSLGVGLFRSGTFALRRDVFDAVGGYAAGLPANQHSEFACRLLPLLQARRWSLFNIADVLVVAHDHGGPKLRKNLDAIFESGKYVLSHHEKLLKQHPQGYAHWAAAVGGCAAKMRNFPEARKWFRCAICVHPRIAKNYFRLLVASTPGLRSLVWRRLES